MPRTAIRPNPSGGHMTFNEEYAQKIRSAETHIAAVRLGVIVLNTLVFAFLLPRSGTIPWLGWSIVGVAHAYALYVLAFHPQERYPILGSSVFTSVSDATLITLWILATGGFASPFYVLWYASIAAIALRFDARTTLLVSVSYMAVYVALLGALGALTWGNAHAVVVRSAYVLFVGILGGWLAHETLTQRNERVRASAMAKRLDAEVERRTQALAESEAKLRHSLHDLQAANERLTELDHLKTLFINNTAHELRTPLTSLKLQLHMLKTAKLGALNERQQRATDMIDRSMERLALLVKDVSDAARFQGGHFRISPEPVDLRELLDELSEILAETARAKGIQWDIVAPPELWVSGDAHRITQVLFNLATNALKFTPPGGRVTTIAEPDGAQALIRVKDTGPGLTHEQTSRLFQAFSQVHDTMTQSESGTGLGLYISKGIVEHHGGDIWCQSGGPGNGTTFAFTLPLQTDPMQPDATVAPPPAEASSRRRQVWAPNDPRHDLL